MSFNSFHGSEEEETSGCDTHTQYLLGDTVTAGLSLNMRFAG